MEFSMESSDHWLQGTSIEECGIMDTLCSSGVGMVERRVRPPQEEAVKCARCESTNTKFCYYNNYSLSQPRYFCKTCRRYWTKGGTLRNIPVGGGCRKNKKVSNNKKSNSNNNDVVLPLPHLPNVDDHHHMQFSSSHPTNMGLMLDHFHSPFEFMGGINNNGLLLGPNFQGFGGNLCSSFDDDDAYNNNNNSGSNYVMDSSSASQQRLMPPHHHNVGAINIHDGKPNINPKILALEWQDQACSDVGKQPFVGGYIGGLGSSWPGMINGYGSSTTNSFV